MTPAKKILLVDDSKTVIHMLRTYLMGTDCEFVQESNGRDSLRCALRERPALIISDIEMPEMDGVELGRAVRSAPGLRASRLVLISSKWTQERRSAVAAIDGVTMLMKPVDPAALSRLVADLPS
jgi:CheY-like chemotaxis protein